MELSDYIRDVPDFPKPGIVFKDITTLLKEPAALDVAIARMSEPFKEAEIAQVVGIESRGFIFGAAIARELGAGFVPIRKPGKLPWETVSATYDLEYGTDTVELHQDAVDPGQRVLMVDDLLATGGTMAAACGLVSGQGAEIVAVSFLVELGFLNGRDRLSGYSLSALITY